MTIGIFDSGIGGLTVLREIVKNKPNNKYIYVGDTLNIPYGNKSKEELLKLSSMIINYLISRKVDLIIIACGTVSSNLANELKIKYDIPIIDIISPTINYLNNIEIDNIGVMATSMTIKSRIFSKQLTNKKVIEIACPDLVPNIEYNNEEGINIALNKYLEIFKKNKIDIIVLGCTHYPIVWKQINSILNNKIQLYNMAKPIVDMIDNNDVSDVLINYTKIDDVIINNTNKILSDINYKTNLIKLD